MTNLESLITKVEKINRDPKYKELKSFWSNFYSLKEDKRIPIIVTLTMSSFARNLGLNLIEHYTEPEKYVEDSLKIILFQHKEIKDDRTKGPIVVTFGEAFEASLFGVKTVFSSDKDPWLGDPIIKSEKDLDELPYPDFYKSGLMPKVHAIYETAKRTVKGRIPVVFERWDRSPWGLAVHLRGLTELLKDTIRNPDFVHKLLRFLTESRIRWEREKERFLGTKTLRSRLSDDEADAQVISPKTYENFAYPYEKELASFYPNGISYFHSCGNITPFLDLIVKIRGLKRIHISPATDFKTAVDRIGRKMVFHKRMDPTKDFALCDDKTMEKRVKETLKIGKGTFMELDQGPIVDAPLDKVKTWVKIARSATKEDPN